MLAILSSNKGFQNPDLWVEYARSHGFKRVDAAARVMCPECEAEESRIIGQFIHYSQLARLRKCRHCALLYSDVVIDSQVIRAHFESAYKDINYHEQGRHGVFRHVADLVDKYSAGNSSLIDIGGGMGHLAGMIAKRHPNWNVVFSDISERSCNYASGVLNVNTVCSSLEDLSQKTSTSFNVLLLVDILYYVQDLERAWHSIARIIGEAESLVILRLPNKIWWIEFRQFLRRRKHDAEMADRIVGMNPEHLYVFGRSYLRNKLRSLGFDSVKFEPSPFTDSNNFMKSIALKSTCYLSKLLHVLSAGKLCLTPSQIVVARRGHRSAITDSLESDRA